MRTRSSTRARKRTALALTAALVATMAPAPVAGSPLGGLLGGVLDPILDPVLDVVEDLFGPLLGEGGPLDLRFDLDTPVDDLVDGALGPLTDTVGGLLTDPTAPPVVLTPGGDGLSPLSGLEVLDGVVEDVAVPGVLAPLGDAVAPVVGRAEPVLAPLGPVVDRALDGAYLSLARLASGVEDAAAYRAVITTPDGTVTRDGVVDVPTAVDVTGDGVQDLTVEVRILTARPSLRVTRLPGAPSSLPVRAEAVIAPAGTGSSERLAVGFDALDSTLPDTVRATLTEGAAGGDTLGVELHTVGAGRSLDVVAGQFAAGPDGPVDPTEVSVGFQPVPEDVAVTTTGATGGDTLAFDLTTSRPTRVDVAVRAVTGADVEELGATVDRVPGALSAAVSRSGDAVAVDYRADGAVDRLGLRQAGTTAGRQRSVALELEGLAAREATLRFDPEDLLAYTASAPIDALAVELTDTAGVVDRATSLRARLEGLPTDLRADLGADELVLDAGDGTLGAIEVLATSGPDLLPEAGTDGLVLRDTADAFVVGARLTGVRSLEATTADDGIAAQLRTVGGRPFVVDVDRGTEAVRAAIDALPASTDVALAGEALTWRADAVTGLTAELVDGATTTALAVPELPTDVSVTLTEAGGLTWTADRTTPTLELERRDPAGIVGRATSLQARIVDLPPVVTLEVADDGASLTADAPVGAIDVLATSGPTLSLDEDAQGVVLRDDADGYALAVRLLGVRELAFAPDPASLTLATDRARPITVDVRTAADGGTSHLQATLADLPRTASLTLDEAADGLALDYTASAPIASVVASLVETRADGGVRTVALDVTDLPATARLSAADDALSIDGSQGIGALAIDVADDAGLVDRATRLSLRAVDLPPALRVELDGQHPSLQVPAGSIGELELLLSDGEEVTVADGTDGIFVRDEADRFVVAARLTGVRGLALVGAASGVTLATDGGRTFVLDAVVPTGEGDVSAVLVELIDLPTEVSLELTGGDGGDAAGLRYTASSSLPRLRAELVTSGDAATRLEAVQLPTELTLAVADDGTITYAADGRLPQLDVELVDPDGVIDDATEARLHVEDLPTGMTLSFGDDGASLATDGGAIGLVELLVTSGPDGVITEGAEGVRLRDTADGFVVAARVSQLSGLSYGTPDGGAELTIDTAGGATFLVDTRVEDLVSGTTTAIAAELSPLPSSVRLGLTDADGARELRYVASAPMQVLDATVDVVSPDGTSEFGLAARDLPSELTLGLDEDGSIGYVASGPLASLAITGRDAGGIFAGATELEAVLTDLPRSATVTLGGDGALALATSGGRLGSLEARAVSADDVPVGLADGVDGISLLDEPGRFGAFLRLTDVAGVSLVTSPVELTLETGGGATFAVDAVLRSGGSLDTGLGDAELRAVLDPLPQRLTVRVEDTAAGQRLALDGTAVIDDVLLSLAQADAAGGAPLEADVVLEDAAPQLSLTLDPTGGVRYRASQAVPLLSIDARDGDGLFDRAGQLKLRLEDLPRGLDLTLSDAGAIAIGTTGGTLGLLEAQATTGPDRRLDAARDGVLLEDLPGRMVVFARFTDLTSVDVAQSPLPAVDLVAGGGRPLEIGLYEAAPGKPSPIANTEFTTALLAPAPAQVDLALLPGEPGQLNIAYQASTTASALSFQTNAGDRWQTSASISNPVPTSFTACQAGDRSCVGGSGRANIGSLAFVANQHTTLDVFDCVRPLNANCRRGGSPSEYLDVANLRVRTLRFAGDVNSDTFPDGNLSFDTDNQTLSGRIVYNAGTRFTLNFNGFRAQDRRGVFTNYKQPRIPWISDGQRVSTSGTTNCSLDLNIRVTVLGIGITLDGEDIIGC